jgi:hypothetical protein
MVSTPYTSGTDTGSPPSSSPVAKARQSTEGTSGCAMSRKRAPPLGASTSAGYAAVSPTSDRHLTRARPPHPALALLLTGWPSLTHGCRPPPTPDTPLRDSADWRAVQGPYLAPPPNRSPTGRSRSGVGTCEAGGIALAQRAQENLGHWKRGQRCPRRTSPGRRIIPAWQSLPGRLVYAGARAPGVISLPTTSPWEA